MKNSKTAMCKQVFLQRLLFIFLFIISNKAFPMHYPEIETLHTDKVDSSFIKRYKDLDKFYSDKKLGSFVESGNTIFRLFAPQAEQVVLCTFAKPEEKKSKDYPMAKDADGVWEISVTGELYGTFYGYKVYQKGEDLKTDKVICLDPYAKAVATYNTYMGTRRAIVVKEGDYNWEGDTWIQRDWRDIIIYEMHVRDQTVHPSSGAKNPGTYKGLTEKGIKGGLEYIKSLGVNTVELLPSMEFANIEIPYMDTLQGRYNTWNPYERNHWGYMTAAFFAPEAYYAENWKELRWNVWEGKSGKQRNEFKDMVKSFHKEGLGVIMDVVFNHLSEYESGNLKEIDHEYYFRLDNKGNYRAESGCGNDLKTERPMTRRLIVESILYWMQEYHIDGFRFDLGKLIDWETIEEIIYQARKINPNVVFVCEPWGGGYDPIGFSMRDWGAWNDQIRNGVKGENPRDGHGWIFGKWYGNNSVQRIKSYVQGTLLRDRHGLFVRKEHSVNYLEAHDGYTFGDFIRIGLREVDENAVIDNPESVVKLTYPQAKLNKLGALFLFTSQGMLMIHSGQEYARSKIIPLNEVEKDKNKGKIDHNSYDKDNAVNYINYGHAELNKGLVEYYKGLAKLRNTYSEFRRAEYEDITFFDIRDNHFALGYQLKSKHNTFLVLFNADTQKKEELILPEGAWQIFVDDKKAGVSPLGEISSKIILEPSTGCVLKLKE